MEVAAAVIVPSLLAWIIGRNCCHAEELRLAIPIFIGLVALWLAPCWATGSTPVSLDFLLEVGPWSAAQPANFLNKNFLLNDVPLQFLPWREAAVRAIRNFDAPFLNRSAVWSPQIENLQVAVFYPLNLLSIAFSTFAWPLFMATGKLLIALASTYLLLRGAGNSFVAAMFGAIAYGFGTFTATYLMFPHSNVTVLLPLLLFTIDRIATTRSLRSTAAAAIVLAAMIAGGHPESVFHCALIALPYAIWRAFQNRPAGSSLLRFAIFGVVGLLLSAPLLVPFALYLPHTQRVGDIATMKGLLNTPPFEPGSFVTYLVPNYFGNPRVHNYRHPFNFNELASQYAGLTTLILAIVAVVREKRRHLFMVVLLVLFILLGTQPAIVHSLLQHVPIFDITAHSRIRFVIALVIAFLGARGFDLLLASERRTSALIAAAVFALTSIICIASYPVFAEYGIRRLVFFTELAALTGAALIAVRFLSVRFDQRLPAMLCGLLFIDLFAVTGLYNPANGPKLFYPETPALVAMKTGATPYRLVGIDRALQPASAGIIGLEDIRPHDPVAYQPYVSLLDRAGFDRSTYFEQFHALPPKPLLDFLGVRFVFSAPAKEISGLPRGYSGRDGNVHVNEGALPRFFVPSGVTPSGDPIASLLSAPDAREVFVAAGPAVATSPASIRIARYDSRRSVIQVTAQQPTFIATSEIALPGFSLTRNDVPWPIRTINGCFAGWDVPAGTSEFALTYTPVGFAAGVAASLLGVLATIGLVAAGSSRAKQTTPAARMSAESAG